MLTRRGLTSGFGLRRLDVCLSGFHGLRRLGVRRRVAALKRSVTYQHCVKSADMSAHSRESQSLKSSSASRSPRKNRLKSPLKRGKRVDSPRPDQRF